MIRIFLPLVCAALGLSASGAMADPAPPSDQETTAPSSSPSTATAAAPGADTTSPPTGRRASSLIGTPVSAADGSPLGTVKDIIFDPQGRATHVVIAYHAEPEEIPDGKPRSRPAGKLVAIPWDTAVTRIAGGRLVLGGKELQAAPSFTAEEWPNLQDPSWSTIADAYWRKVAPAPASARRNAQIDSTARLRDRPTRDGD